MKKICISTETILIVIFTVITIFSQANNGFWEKYDIIAKNYNIKTGFPKEFSSDDILDLAISYKREKESNPVKFILTRKSRFEEWGNEIKNNQYYNVPKPALLLRKIKEKMIQHLGINYIEAISIDYLLKVLVESVDSSIYYTNDNKKELQINIQCKIEDVLKDKMNFQIGENITISCLNWWTEKSPKKFEIGSTYLIPIRPWKVKNEHKFELTIHFLYNNKFDIYPIENEDIKFSSNFLGLENYTSWTTFKNNFFSLLNLYGE